MVLEGKWSRECESAGLYGRQWEQGGEDAEWDLRGQLVSSLVVSETLERPVTVNQEM